MMHRLKKEYSGAAEDGWKRNFLDAAVARFAELLEHQATYEALVQALVVANNAMFEQIKFSQNALRLLSEQITLKQAAVESNGHSKAIERSPNVETKGE
jgi:hypothetical protein